MSSSNIDQKTPGQGVYAQGQKPRGWWSRNCGKFMLALLIIFVLICSFPAALFYGIVGLRSKEPYKLGLQKIQADPQSQQAFGQPIKDNSWLPAGEITEASGRGNAELRWDLVGPKGKGKAYVKARLMEGKWEIVIIEVNLPDGKKILLHEEGPDGSEAPAFSPGGTAEPEKPQETAPALDLNPSIPMPEETGPKK